jgi:RNA polymerase sigma factor (sigma-70 family)
MNEELALVSRIVCGDAGAWEAFCRAYSPVIERSIRRYIPDPETRRDLYVSLLEELKLRKLKSFAGRSTLAAWLFIVARNHCRDYYRSEGGVRRLRSELRDLGPDERRFFDLAYVQGLPVHQVFEAMRAEKKGAMTYLDLIEYDEAVRRAIAKKKLERLAERLLRPEAGPRALRGGGQSLEGRDVPDAAAQSPEELAAAERLERSLEELRAAVLRLAPEDRRLLELRFDRRLTAKRIAEELSIGGEKKVYHRLERIFRELRGMFKREPSK